MGSAAVTVPRAATDPEDAVVVAAGVVVVVAGVVAAVEESEPDALRLRPVVGVVEVDAVVVDAPVVVVAATGVVVAATGAAAVDDDVAGAAASVASRALVPEPPPQPARKRVAHVNPVRKETLRVRRR